MANAWDAARDGKYDFLQVRVLLVYDVTVQALLKHEPQHANIKDEHDVTPLTYAIIGEKPHMVRLLLENGAKVNTKRSGSVYAPSHRCSKTSLPITFACLTGNLEIVKNLLEYNPRLKALSKHGALSTFFWSG